MKFGLSPSMKKRKSHFFRQLYSRAKYRMNIFKIILFRELLKYLYFDSWLLIRVRGVQFSAVTDTPAHFIRRLYAVEWNEDAPSELDPATKLASVRLQLCEEIIGRSGIFFDNNEEEMFSNSTKEIQAGLKDLKYYDIFNRIFAPTSESSPTAPRYEYTNEYAQQIFKSSDAVYRKEFVFVCLLMVEQMNSNGDDIEVEDDSINPIAIFYVSKAYKAESGIRAHRFVFTNETSYPHLMLVDGAATVHTRAGFNVELHYLELKKYHHQEDGKITCDLDPVCRLSLRDVPEGNQLNRLCSIVLTSPYFEDQIKCPSRWQYDGWFEEEISFRTSQGKEEANKGRRYSEFMIGCFAIMKNGNVKSYHVSRAYNPDQVFVYVEDPVNDEFFLEYLSTNVGIVHERYNFGEVEI